MKKQSNYDNFIGVYDGYFSDDFCDNLIKHFEWCLKSNKTWRRKSEADSIYKEDSATTLNPQRIEELDFLHPEVQNYIEEFNDVFWNQCYAEYIEKYGALKQAENHTIFTYKLQKTLPSEGYHIWHSESMSKSHCRRLGVYMVYLNDVDEGGETEFLYFSQRIKPKKGRLIIWPPNYPWTHRGNPPLSGVKYVLTGWTEFN